MNCTTHHYACDCREAMFKELDKRWSDAWGYSVQCLDQEDFALENLAEIRKLREALGLTSNA
jgi:hypothetical protein